jgi:hypothetical protein
MIDRNMDFAEPRSSNLGSTHDNSVHQVVRHTSSAPGVSSTFRHLRGMASKAVW